MNIAPNKWWPPVGAWIAVGVIAMSGLDGNTVMVVAVLAMIVSGMTD